MWWLKRGEVNYASVLWRDMVEWLSCTLFPEYALVRRPSTEKFAVKKSPVFFFCQNDHDVTSEWPRCHFRVTTMSLQSDRDVTSEWPQCHLRVTAMSRQSDRDVTSEWPQCHVRVIAMSRQSDRDVTSEWPRCHFRFIHWLIIVIYISSSLGLCECQF